MNAYFLAIMVYHFMWIFIWVDLSMAAKNYIIEIDAGRWKNGLFFILWRMIFSWIQKITNIIKQNALSRLCCINSVFWMQNVWQKCSKANLTSTYGVLTDIWDILSLCLFHNVSYFQPNIGRLQDCIIMESRCVSLFNVICLSAKWEYLNSTSGI